MSWKMCAESIVVVVAVVVVVLVRKQSCYLLEAVSIVALSHVHSLLDEQTISNQGSSTGLTFNTHTHTHAGIYTAATSKIFASSFIFFPDQGGLMISRPWSGALPAKI
jgi:hypothetical protein